MGDQREIESRALAAGQFADRHQSLVLAEAEPAQAGADGFGERVRQQRGEMVIGRLLGPHLFDLMLGKETAGQLRRPGHLAGEGRQAAGEQPGKGGLAVAIGAEQGDAVIRVEAQIELRQHRLTWGISGAGPVQRDQWRAQLRRLRQA